MKLNQVEPVVESLSQGPLLRKILALALRILAVAAAFIGLFFFLGLLGSIINAIGHNVPQALGMLVAMGIELVVFFLAVKILLFRAKSVLIQSDADYPVVSLSALLLRAIGEVTALFYSGLGLVACITIWFGGDFTAVPNMLRSLLFTAVPDMLRPLLFPTPPFVLGLTTILVSQFNALLALVFFYLAAELLLLLRNIAVNTRK